MGQIEAIGMTEKQVSAHAQKSMISDKHKFSSLSHALSYHEKIIHILKKHSSGLTVAEICRLVGITRNTAAVSLARLEGAEQVELRKVGMAKIYSLKPEVQIKMEAEED